MVSPQVLPGAVRPRDLHEGDAAAQPGDHQREERVHRGGGHLHHRRGCPVQGKGAPLSEGQIGYSSDGGVSVWLPGVYILTTFVDPA